MRLDPNLDPTVFEIGGTAHAAVAQGLDDPDFRAPLISHIDGNLWSGGCIDGIKLPDDFKHVVSLYPWERYAVGPDTRVTEIRMYDGLDEDLSEVDAIAELVVRCVQEGKTLVHCQAGLNRSGLVTARALMMMGRSADEAIALLREKRHRLVLCNLSFEDWLRALA